MSLEHAPAQSKRGAGSRRLLLSRIAVIVLALVALYDSLNTISRWWSPHGFIGISIDEATAIVSDVETLNGTTGIRPGDRVDLAAMPFRERSYLYENLDQPAGLRMTVPLIRGDHRRSVTITVAPFVKPTDGNIFSWTRRVVSTIFVATGVILVWNRPSVMLWGLTLVLLGSRGSLISPFASPIIAALLIFAAESVRQLVLPGLIIFTARFPDGRANNTTKFWDVAAAGVFIALMVLDMHDYVPLFTAHPISDWPDETGPYSAMLIAVFIALCIKLRKNNRSTRGGFGWIVAGYGIGVVLGSVVLPNYVPGLSFWDYFGLQVLKLAFPASVAYSLIRHRSFGLGYLTNRTLVFASLTVGVVATFLIGVWATSSQLSSTLGIGIAMFFALLVGMTFAAQRGRAIRFVDRIFLPHRYEAGVSLDRIRETLRGTNDAKRVTGEVAATLGLASVAVFERASDGGFVRNAAYGWPDGTAWHLLPGEGLTHSLVDDGATVVALPDQLSGDCAFPPAQARPSVALTIRRGGRVERAIFVGHYADGALLDRDAIRSMHGVFADALVR